MNFRRHSNLEGQHAFLSPSKYHWLNYDEEKLSTVYTSFQAAQRGTELHEFAKRCIELKIKLPRTKQCLNRFVNDAIGHQMIPEQPLYFSENCFGTADAISFKDGLLRVHDLKTGVTPASMKQLEIYDALFCLEYDVSPMEIDIENRIYQFDDVEISKPESDTIRTIMDKIIIFDRKIEEMRLEG